MIYDLAFVLLLLCVTVLVLWANDRRVKRGKEGRG